MNKIKFITFTDVHISDNNPSSRKGNYFQDILDKLTQIGRVGKKLEVDFYAFAGDLYHFKAPTRNSHKLNRKLIEVFNQFNAPIYSTEGNHDLRQDSYETFGEQPISVLYTTGALKQIRDEIFDIKGFKIRINSIPFTESPDINLIPRSTNDDVDLNICLLHLYSSLKGGSLFGQKIYSYKDISILGDDIFVLGHYHIDQGISLLKKYEHEQYFINVGAISRGSIADDDIKRCPKICYVTVDLEKNKKPNIKIQPIKLKVKSAEEVFDLEKKKEEKEKIKDAELFVSALKEEIDDMGYDINNIDQEIDKTKIEKLVVEKVKHYLSEADFKIKEII